ncbi:MAG: 23S rRNA (guanosine(2251)-2'-O)-methyltransferase RlmB [Nitrospinaceae bacterium]|nr:23S rRNA (guanosine(2251)-2'-O)-methyltransferase RlmB [Nitrospinaceae bacterium]NIR56113.1 23S rRNA (guanosine(2251)-2'-O)-methyltransferase RlmB [Nitrospinaceae bacterium]NIS86561.1 23S rRNA (guanosine(2251)-2'-O)-methyltransferase RlmB [Nitrospinaceae bacterium]NIT83395.1 23S rRNA (guanosine(2251)-2'-O)-methyltransferase RlmB [Nitrospinaceae bacterium]NIU45605.1 23S rRNA (guanosine(2251)-2'-O)-methyltransferase RlmB [Nitrospinaceae bacterium]
MAQDSLNKNARGSSSQKAPSKRTPRKKREFTVYGWNACQQVFARRPQDILRLYFHQSRSSQLQAVKQWCSQRKLPYRKLDKESLNKVAASVHHEGCVMVVRPLDLPSVHDFVRQGLRKDQFALALDRVENPHNIGAILRSCAYFGARGLLVGAGEGAGALNPSMARMAEGALETVPLYECKSLSSVLRDLKSRGVWVLGADPDAPRSLYDLALRFPALIVVGNEQEGLSAPVKKRCDALAHIPGSGAMQSLNVSVAAGLMLAELTRQQPSSPKPQKK